MKKIIFISVLCISLIVIGAIFYNKQKEDNYIELSKKLTDDLIATYTISNAITDFYTTVWRNAIFKENSYWNPGPYHQKEFSEALLIAKEQLESEINTTDSLVAEINIITKEINNPPSKYISLHNDIVNMYALVMRMYQLGKFPTGSFNSFMETKSKNNNDLMEVYNKIKAQI